jgi:hypothetical protein
LKGLTIFDSPGLDECCFDMNFIFEESRNHHINIPIFIYNLNSGTPDLHAYNYMLKHFSDFDVPSFFIFTGLKTLVRNMIMMRELE